MNYTLTVPLSVWTTCVIALIGVLVFTVWTMYRNKKFVADSYAEAEAQVELAQKAAADEIEHIKAKSIKDILSYAEESAILPSVAYSRRKWMGEIIIDEFSATITNKDIDKGVKILYLLMEKDKEVKEK